MSPLLAISDLSVTFATERGQVQALDGVSLSLNAGETLAVVGESGSGKSVTALSIMGLLGDSGRVGERHCRPSFFPVVSGACIHINDRIIT
mgnify:CR=1 FL=1